MSYPGGSMPSYPAAYPAGGGDPNYRPSGGTALTAAGLAIPGGLISLWVGIVAITGLGNTYPANTDVKTALVIAVIAGLLSGLALLVGAGLIFGGKPLGRWLVVLGCVVVVAGLLTVAGMVGSKIAEIATDQGDQINSGAATGASLGAGVIYSIPAIATFILAIVPLSGRYLAFRSGGSSQVISPGAQMGFGAQPQQGYQQPGYQQQPGYPQQQGFPPSTPGGFPQQGGTYPPSNPGGFPQQPPQPGGNPPQQW